jgi:hypothetical protein
MVKDEEVPEEPEPEAVPGQPFYLGAYIVGVKLKHVVVIEDRGDITT